jgi:hypothetical protein
LFFGLQVNKFLYPKSPAIKNFSESINPADLNVIDLNKEKLLFFFTAYDSLK